MATAYKCDRCGKFYEENILTHEDVRRWHVGKIKHENGKQYEPPVDLCGNCQNALEQFLLKKTLAPDEVFTVLVTHGQGDKRFKLGETIKYSPSEVEEILKGRVNNG